MRLVAIPAKEAAIPPEAGAEGVAAVVGWAAAAEWAVACLVAGAGVGGANPRPRIVRVAT